MYELLVVGDDPAGLATATRAARRGLSVALAHPIVDALDSNAYLSEAIRELIPELAVDFERGRSREFGTRAIQSPDHLRQLVIKRVKSVAARRLEAVRAAGVEIFTGQPRFLDENSVELAGEDTGVVLRAHCIAVATGSSCSNDLRTQRPGSRVVNADQILNLNSLPGRLIVIGANPRGIEFAGLFAVSGTRVTVVDNSVDQNPKEDWLEADSLFDISLALGVGFRRGVDVVGLNTDMAHTDFVSVQLGDGNKLRADRVLVAERRIGKTRSLDLKAAGLVTDDCYRLWCDHQHRTWLPHIYGVGEVVGFSPRDLDALSQAKTVVDAIVQPRRVPAPMGLGRNGKRARSRLRLV